MVEDKDQQIIKEALARFDQAQTAEQESRERSIDDIKFVHDDDAQWTEEAKRLREGRPCMTFDHTSSALDQILGDFLQARPGIKVRAVDDGADPKTADVYTGLIRNIESVSGADRAYKNAFKFSATGGFGVWRVVTDYEAEDSFNQEIGLQTVNNPFSILFDPSAQHITRHDGNFCFAHEFMSEEEFKAQYPGKLVASADTAVGNDYEGWFMDGMVRIAEYFRKVPVTKTIVLLNTGEVVDLERFEKVEDELAAEGIKEVRRREVQSHKIEWFKLSASQILERGEWAGKYFPLIPCFGKEINIEGKTHYRGTVRKAKDPQRAYNYQRSQIIETLSLQPKAPYLATPKMLSGLEREWKSLNTTNKPVLRYNIDPEAPGSRPTRDAPPQFPAALMQEALLDLDDIKAATGIHDASLGARGNETSGKAILARQREGDTGNYEFFDNAATAIEHTGKILLDLIPRIYDTQRVIRVLGEDGAENYEPINKVVYDRDQGREVILNDLSQGRFDVAIDTGPAYSTKRVETAEQLTAVMQANPQLGLVLSDLWVKSLDLVGADDAVERVRKMLIKQGMIEPNKEELEEMAPQIQASQQQAAQAAQLQQAMTQLEMQKTATETTETQANIINEWTQTAVDMMKTAQDTGDATLYAAGMQKLMSPPQ